MKINNRLNIERYPATLDKTLKAWNAADELILAYLDSNNLSLDKIIIYHDRFGFLTCHLNEYNPLTIVNFKSQEIAIQRNQKKNGLHENESKKNFALNQLYQSYKTAIIKIPKSTDLFELYLQQLNPAINDTSEVICGFMTRHFSKQTLEIAHKYFEDVEQTKAQRKARLMILRKPKTIEKENLVHKIKWSKDKYLQQYYGVFSASKIDRATQFLLENLEIKPHQQHILDLGCGNGVLAWKARQLNPSAHIYLTDDNYLAIESAKLNLGSSPFHHFYFTNSLKDFETDSMDLVISNPPFHFEHENNIEITLHLFKEVSRILKTKGEFRLVANIHLNYKSHLTNYFKQVETINENKKFVIYNCRPY